MKKFLLPLLSLAMVFVLSCTSDLKMISEDTLSQPLITSELADVTFSQNFTIRSSGSTSFIIDPGTKSITRYNFEVYFDETNISENGNPYLSAVVAETTYTNGYQIYLSPSQDAVDLYSRTVVKCYFKIKYDDDTKSTEYSFDVILNEDTPMFETHPFVVLNDTLPTNFTMEDFVQVQFELNAGEFEDYIDTNSFTVMGLSNRMLTHYSIVRSENPDSANWYTVTLQPSAKAVLRSDEYTNTLYIQLLYTDATNAAYTVDSYTCSVYMPADVYTPYFVGGVEDIIFSEDYLADEAVVINFTMWDQNTDLYIADVLPFDSRGLIMRDQTGYKYSDHANGRPLATNGTGRSVSGNNVTLNTTFTALYGASDYPNGINEQIELKVVYDDDLYSESDSLEGYVSTYTTLYMPESRGTAVPTLSSSVSTITIKSDFEEGPIGGYTANMGTENKTYSSFEEFLEGTVTAGTYSFTETTNAFTLVSDIWIGTIGSEDFWLDISGPNASWIDETKTVFSETPEYSQSMAFTFTIQPSEEAVDYYKNQSYKSWEDYAEFPMDTGNVVIYIKCGYNKQYVKDAEGNFVKDEYGDNIFSHYADTITCPKRITPMFLPPTPEGLVSINSTETYPNAYFFCPEDEVDETGRVAFTWEEAMELCANKERHPMLPWDYVLPPLYQMRAVTYRKYADFYDFDNKTSTLSCGTGNSDEYWTSTESWSEYGYLARVLQATKNYTNQHRSKENTYRVRCAILKYDRTYYDSVVPDVLE